MSYRPTSIYTDCGNGYGIAMVRDGSGDPVRAGVDLNTTDGTANPRIQVNGAWVDVDQDFVTAYRAMTSSRALVGDSRNTACRAVNGGTDPVAEPGATPAGSGTIGWGWNIVPVLAIGGSYGVNRIARSDLFIASRNPGTVGTTVDLGYGGLATTYAFSLPIITRRSDSGWFWAMNGGSLAVGTGLIIAGLSEHGRGTPEFSTGLTMATSGGVGMIYGDRDSSRRPERFWPGFLIQGAAGITGLTLFFTGVGSRPTVSGGDIYAPPGTPPGTRGSPDNPYETSLLPGVNRDFLWYGISNLAAAGITFLDYNLLTGPGTERGGPQAANRPTLHLSAMSPPGGGVGLQAFGTW